MNKEANSKENMLRNYCRNSLKWLLTQTKILDFYSRSKIFEAIFSVNNKRILQKQRVESLLRLHLGCGSKILKGWINIDSIWRPNVIVLKLPQGLKAFKKNSVEYIYACHLLEHLEYPRKVMNLLENCYCLLKPGGVMRIGVPNIEVIIHAYAANNREFFKIQSILHPSWCTTKLEHLMYALQQDGEHKYGYDFETLQKALCEAGFNKVIKKDFGQSEFEALKVDYRIDHKEDDHLTLYVDAIKAP